MIEFSDDAVTFVTVAGVTLEGEAAQEAIDKGHVALCKQCSSPGRKVYHDGEAW